MTAALDQADRILRDKYDYECERRPGTPGLITWEQYRKANRRQVLRNIAEGVYA